MMISMRGSCLRIRGSNSCLFPVRGRRSWAHEPLMVPSAGTRRTRDEDTAPGFTANYERAFTISELYSLERPAPIPLEEHEQRRRRKDQAEIVEAAARKGKSEAYVRERLSSLETLLPNVINLHKLKASDWATIINDVDAVAAKLVALKSVFPGANVFKVVSKMPRLLLSSTESVQKDADQVRQALSSLPNPDAIIEVVPELVSPQSLARALATLKAAMPGQDPLQVLQKNPEVLYSLGGEADMEDSAEYGELSTKD